MEADLTRIAVTGDLLTIEVRFRNLGTQQKHLPIDVRQVSFIDDATSRRYSVVKDLSDQWMASAVDLNWAQVYVEPGSYTSVWFKFPAPPPEMKSLSILIPYVSPFDGIPMPR